MDGMDDALEAFQNDEVLPRVPCPVCQRKFNEDVLTRHIGICEKSAKKRRKPFNSQKQRMTGSDIPNEGMKQNTKEVKIPKKNNWKAKHEAFLASIRAARGSSSTSTPGGAPVNVPAPVNPDYVQCPHCERRFNEHSAQRHIEFCKEQKSRIAYKKAGSQDLSRLAKRTQYKPPLPGKRRSAVNSDSSSAKSTQRSVLSPKYSSSGYVPSSVEKVSQVGGRSPGSENLTKQPAVRRTQSSKVLAARKEAVSRRHSDGPSNFADNDGLVDQRLSSKNFTENGVGSPSKPNTVQRDIFHDDDISRAASGNRRNRSLQKATGTLKDEFDGQVNNKASRKKLGPRFSDLGNMDDGSGSGEDSDSWRPSGRNRRQGSRHSSAGSNASKAESGISVGSMIGGTRNKLSKFCHECGTKYPVPNAKFCCECGMKRLYIEH